MRLKRRCRFSNPETHGLTADIPAQLVLLDADGIRLDQVFSNLLNNAGKYTEPGGSILFDAVLEGQQVLVRVSDKGIGKCGRDAAAHFRNLHLGRFFERLQSGLVSVCSWQRDWWN